MRKPYTAGSSSSSSTNDAGAVGFVEELPVAPEGTDPLNVYVVDLPLSFTKEQFQALYEPFGNLVTSTVLSDPATAVSRGIGFARYSNRENAARALKETQGMMLPGATKPLLVRFAKDSSRKYEEQTAASLATLSQYSQQQSPHTSYPTQQQYYQQPQQQQAYTAYSPAAAAAANGAAAAGGAYPQYGAASAAGAAPTDPAAAAALQQQWAAWYAFYYPNMPVPQQPSASAAAAASANGSASYASMHPAAAAGAGAYPYGYQAYQSGAYPSSSYPYSHPQQHAMNAGTAPYPSIPLPPQPAGSKQPPHSHAYGAPPGSTPDMRSR